MQKISLLLACLACVGQGIPLHSSGEQARSRPDADSLAELLLAFSNPGISRTGSLASAHEQALRVTQRALAGALAAAIALASPEAYAADAAKGDALFQGNCAACHAGGQNVIVQTKTLSKDDLTKYLDGGFKEASIIQQVKYGKNAMPAFSGRLSDEEISNIAAYVFDQADNSKWEN
mmetsp:Transcript_98951/g.180557  ORF Transcript_98951/g.180557 Transcript_98951/m.180557 type:complete len:177 (-) Transcript_98951:58-588(-)